MSRLYKFVPVIDQTGKSSFGLYGSALALHAGGPGFDSRQGHVIFRRWYTSWQLGKILGGGRAHYQLRVRDKFGGSGGRWCFLTQLEPPIKLDQGLGCGVV